MKLLFSLLFISWVSFVSGQQIQLSEDLSKQGVEDYKILGKYGDQILVFTSEKGRHSVMAFDKKMHLLWSKRLEFELKRISIVEVIPQKDAFNVVYKFSKAGETNLKILKFNPSCEQIDSNLIKKFDRWSYSVNPKIVLSEDKESVLFYESEQYQSLEAYAFNLDKMELIWDQVFRLQYFNYHENF